MYEFHEKVFDYNMPSIIKTICAECLPRIFKTRTLITLATENIEFILKFKFIITPKT